jgi:hypothetical protein
LDAGEPGVLITTLTAFADALDLSIDVGTLRVLGAYFGIARHRRTGCRFPSIRPLLVPPAGFPARPTVVDPCGPLPVDWAVPAVFVPVAVVPREAAAESPGLPRLGDAPPVWFADPADPRLEAAPANPGLDAPADPGLVWHRWPRRPCCSRLRRPILRSRRCHHRHRHHRHHSGPKRLPPRRSPGTRSAVGSKSSYALLSSSHDHCACDVGRAHRRLQRRVICGRWWAFQAQGAHGRVPPFWGACGPAARIPGHRSAQCLSSCVAFIGPAGSLGLSCSA